MEGIFTRDLNSETISMLSFPEGLDRKTVFVDMYVNVGVRHQPTERLIADLAGAKYHSYSPPTLSTSIDALRPVKEHLGWRFSGEVEIGDTVEDMAATIREYALPWMEAHATLEWIFAALQQVSHPIHQSGGDPLWALRMPVMYALSGNREAGREFVQETFASIASSKGLWDEYYRQFAANFLNRFP